MSIYKKWSLIGVSLWLVFIFRGDGISQTISMKTIRFGISAGLGLPKIPIAQFRAPISVLGGGSVNIRFVRKMALQINGYGLHTFGLGTINNRNDQLRFDVVWVSADLLCHMGGIVSNESFVALGLGQYHLSRQYEDDRDNLNTIGLNIGWISWSYHTRWNSVLEIRWHLLFNPSDKPQVVTITFGLLL
ncbi:hypothetical protein JW824_07500 [bacterium]|nr:hypothetical protein [bacterium]RQV95069.1 MAG: hypothetical protein EH221_06890 [bacterium]